MAIKPADERILRAKYLDWCSARVADRFLELTPDQIYELAHRPIRRGASHGAATATVESPDGGSAEASHRSGVAAAPSSYADAEGAVAGGVSEGEAEVADAPLDYASLVARATEALAAQMELPTFSVWLARYEREPEQYEKELLGLWKPKA